MIFLILGVIRCCHSHNLSDYKPSILLFIKRRICLDSTENHTSNYPSEGVFVKNFTLLILGLVLLVSIIGCRKNSVLEGKVVNGKGEPIADIKVVAKQVDPIKGYDYFECNSGANGEFKFNKLYPTSDYKLIILPNGYKQSISMDVKSGYEERPEILQNPIIINFIVPKDGTTVIDTSTGLMWPIDGNLKGTLTNGEEWGKGLLNFNTANEWANSLNYAGYKDNKNKKESYAKH